MRELRQSCACSCGTEELRSKLDSEALELFMVPDAGVSELILPVCDQLGEDDLAAALGRLAARPEQLSVVQLGFCGHGLTPAVAALSSPPVRAATCTRCASPAASRPPRSWRCARRGARGCS